MTVVVTHTHQSALTDNPSFDVSANVWNANHTITGLGNLADNYPLVTTDNGVPRFDGTGGALQTSLWQITDAGALAPITTDTGALGSTTYMVSDLFLADGGVINWNSGDITVTGTTGTLTFAGATGSGYNFDYTIKNTMPDPSLSKGIYVIQRGETSSSGNSTSPFYWNHIDVNSRGQSFATDTETAYALAVGHGVGGATAFGQKVAITGFTVINSATGDSATSGNFVGIVGSCHPGDSVTIGTDTGSGARGYIIGANLIGTLNAGAQNYLCVTAAELLSGMRTGSTCTTHVGVRIIQWNDHAADPATLSAAVQIGAQTGSIGWKHYGILFDESSTGFTPYDPGTSGTIRHGFQSGSTLIAAISSATTMTVNNGIDFSAVSITTNAWSSFQAQITGGGGGHFANIGFSAGAGGQVTQLTDKTTAVTLNKPSGQITLAAGTINSAAHTTFQVNNTAFTATRGDTVMAKHQSGGTSGAYGVSVSHSGTNAFNLIVENLSGGNLNEQPVIAFNVIRGSTS